MTLPAPLLPTFLSVAFIVLHVTCTAIVSAPASAMVVLWHIA